MNRAILAFVAALPFVAGPTAILAHEPEAPKVPKGKDSLPDRYPYVVKDTSNTVRPRRAFGSTWVQAKGRLPSP